MEIMDYDAVAGDSSPLPSQISVPRLICYATRSGGSTLDADDAGGNPFASALIEAACEPGLQLRNLPMRLHELTATKSDGHQFTEVFGHSKLQDWSFHDAIGERTERREALVLVVSDYSKCDSGGSLNGAALDERRIAAMLAQCGFSVVQGVAPTRAALTQALASFGDRSKRSEIGVIYSTGHGLELDGEVYLVPGDYPDGAGYGSTLLKRHAVSVAEMTNAACASRQNLIFFAGCRTHVSRRE